MLSIEQLSSLDLRAWLGSQQEAASHLQYSQSQICRNNRQSLAVLSELGLELQRPLQHLHCDELGMLTKLRQVHQWMRFRDQSGLRLQSSCWLRHLLLEPLPEGWTANRAPVDRFNDCEPLVLLEHHVIDAALVTGPERPEPDHPCLASVLLCRQPLQLLVSAEHPLHRERGLSTSEIGDHSDLAHSSFIHPRARQCMELVDRIVMGAPPARALCGLKGEPPPQARRYGTAMTCLIRPDLGALDVCIPQLAHDVLVVHRDWIEHGAIRALALQLRQGLQQLQHRINGLELAC